MPLCNICTTTSWVDWLHLGNQCCIVYVFVVRSGTVENDNEISNMLKKINIKHVFLIKQDTLLLLAWLPKSYHTLRALSIVLAWYQKDQHNLLVEIHWAWTMGYLEHFPLLQNPPKDVNPPCRCSAWSQAAVFQVRNFPCAHLEVFEAHLCYDDRSTSHGQCRLWGLQ